MLLYSEWVEEAVLASVPHRQYVFTLPRHSLECPQCNGPMRVIALIEDPGIIRRILEHSGLWAPLATERSPPLVPASWPRHANLPLAYHPVPDIA